MKKSLILLLLLQISGSIFCGEISPETFEVNHITPKNDVITISPFYYLKSGYSTNPELLTGNLAELGFKRFTPGPLDPHQKGEKVMYTFRSQFYVDEYMQERPLSVYLGISPYPREIFINGVRLKTRGSTGDLYNAFSILATNVDIYRELLNYGREPNEIAIKYYQIYHNSTVSHVMLGDYYKLEAYVFQQNFICQNLAQAAVIISFIIFCYYLFLFIKGRFKETKYFYFSLTCIAFAVAYSNMAFYYDGADQFLLDKISRIAFPFLITSLVFFVNAFTGIGEKSKIVKGIYLTLTAFFVITTALQPDISGVSDIFSTEMLFFIAPTLFYCIPVLCISILKNKHKNSIPVLFGMLAILAAGLHDMSFTFIPDLVPYTYFAQFGYLTLVISVFFVLALEQSAIYLSSIKQTKKINKQNTDLKEIITKISNTSEKLIGSSDNLNGIVDESQHVLDDFETKNKKIGDTIVSRLEKLDTMIKKIQERMEVSSRRVPEAVLNQTSIVEEISATLTTIAGHLSKTMKKTTESNMTVQNLTRIATNSTDVIQKSKKTINSLSGYSHFIKEVLTAVEDITERTNILSINAAIESARQGQQGKGFAVVASEIRKLAYKSKETLESSYEKIGEMHKAITESSDLSDKVSESLFTIIDKIKESSDMTGLITTLMKEQKSESEAILIAVKNLLQDSVTIKELSEEEKNENEKIAGSLNELKGFFDSIGTLVDEQNSKRKDLAGTMLKVQSVSRETIHNAEALKGAISNIQ